MHFVYTYVNNNNDNEYGVVKEVFIYNREKKE